MALLFAVDSLIASCVAVGDIKELAYSLGIFARGLVSELLALEARGESSVDVALPDFLQGNFLV